MEGEADKWREEADKWREEAADREMWQGIARCSIT